MLLLHIGYCDYGLAVLGTKEQLYMAYKPAIHVSISLRRQGYVAYYLSD